MIDGILEFTFHPVSKKSQGYTMFFASLLIAAAFVFNSVTALRYKGLISLAAVIFMCVAVYIFSRYIGCAYAYAVVYDGEDTPNLLVTKTIGKRLTTLANFPLHAIQTVVKSDADNKKSGDKPYPVYNYSVSVFPKKTYSVYFLGRDVRARLVLECSDELAERLLQYAALAKAEQTRRLNEEI